MRTVSAIARYLAGVIFLVFGLNGFLNFTSGASAGGIAGQFNGKPLRLALPVGDLSRFRSSQRYFCWSTVHVPR